ncbi:hypothetical protein [Paraburkholderia sp. MM5482-R1]|uniref:hypothetical protein n=1 Tax=unclassified Paraburkholderia TaxID=2615204 RepID=UPI003D19711C
MTDETTSLTSEETDLVLRAIDAVLEELADCRSELMNDVREVKACLNRLEISVALLHMEIARRWAVLDARQPL